MKEFGCNDLMDDTYIDNNDCQHDVFRLLMHCHPKFKISEKYILKLIKKIQEETNATVFVAITKMNEWKICSFKNLINDKCSNIATTTDTNKLMIHF